MKAVDVFLRQFDEAWHHEWESLMPVLEWVTEEQAHWQAPCYRSDSAEEGEPLPGTIHWHVAHLAHCKQHYTARIQGRDADKGVRSPNFLDALKQLRDAHGAQRKVLATLSDEDLSREIDNGMRLDEYLTSIIRHDIWHAAQIAVAKRLWTTRESG